MITVLGRLKDTEKYIGVEGYNVFNTPDSEYTFKKNAEWLQTAIDRGDEILLVTTEDVRDSMYHEELKLLLELIA